MRLSEAAGKGICRLRKPAFDEHEYIRIDVFKGRHGPWMHLFYRGCQEAIGEPTPQHVLCIGDTTDDYEEYTGPIDAADFKLRKELGGTT